MAQDAEPVSSAMPNTLTDRITCLSISEEKSNAFAHNHARRENRIAFSSEDVDERNMSVAVGAGGSEEGTETQTGSTVVVAAKPGLSFLDLHYDIRLKVRVLSETSHQSTKCENQVYNEFITLENCSNLFRLFRLNQFIYNEARNVMRRK